MSYIELILFLVNRNETILADRAHEIITAQGRYIRTQDGMWTMDTEKGELDVAYTRGGPVHIWKKTIAVEVGA